MPHFADTDHHTPKPEAQEYPRIMDESSTAPLLEFVSRIEIIHLPERVDRYQALERELSQLGIPIRHPKVSIPEAPVPADAFGFRSRGVHGNYLSHLDILTRALDDELSTIMVLEDDAIFRSWLRRAECQRQLIDALSSQAWDMCFLGHGLADVPHPRTSPLMLSRAPFKWAHCYIINGPALKPLVHFLNGVLHRPAGECDRAYHDGARRGGLASDDLSSAASGLTLRPRNGTAAGCRMPVLYR